MALRDDRGLQAPELGFRGLGIRLRLRSSLIGMPNESARGTGRLGVRCGDEVAVAGWIEFHARGSHRAVDDPPVRKPTTRGVKGHHREVIAVKRFPFVDLAI